MQFYQAGIKRAIVLVNYVTALMYNIDCCVLIPHVLLVHQLIVCNVNDVADVLATNGLNYN